MAGNYRLTSHAETDLEELFEYSVSNFGEAQPDRYVAGMIARFEFLVDNPLAGAGKAHIKADTRLSVYGPHSIYYLVQEETLLILRIPGSGRDPVREP